MKIKLSKLLLAAGLIIFIGATLTSCQSKEGCPNKITQTGILDFSDNS
jgi:hypothetical protein